MIGKKGRVTDLKGVHRSIRKTSSILSSAIAEAPKQKHGTHHSCDGHLPYHLPDDRCRL